MVQFFDSIPARILKWIPKQHMFFVATAPLTGDGRVNLSPKGYDDTFHVIDENTVWYEDLSGSGIETVSHVKENGRITIMFVAFEGPPNIVRFFGRGTVHEFGTPEYDSLISPESRKPGSRAVIMVNVYQVSTSCGYGVPFYSFQRNRNTLMECFSAKEMFDIYPSEATPERGLRAYWANKNVASLDGVPGLDYAATAKRDFKVENLYDTRGRFATPGKNGKVIEAPDHLHPAKTLLPYEMAATEQKQQRQQQAPVKTASGNSGNTWTTLFAGFVVGLMMSRALAKVSN